MTIPQVHNPKKQKSLYEAFSVSQVTADKLIKNYIIQEMRPLSTVDKSAFKELVNGLNPNVHVLSRKTLASRINQEYLQMKDVLKKEFQQTLCAQQQTSGRVISTVISVSQLTGLQMI